MADHQRIRDAARVQVSCGDASQVEPTDLRPPLEIPCPACEARVELESRSLGEWMECSSCRIRFQVYLVRNAQGDLQLETRAAAGGESGPGVRVLDRFEVLGELGRGGQGVVYRVRPKGGRTEYALKYLDSRPLAAGSARSTEQEMGALLNHPNLVALFTTGYDLPSGTPLPPARSAPASTNLDEVRRSQPGILRPYAVFEVVDGGSLRGRIVAGGLDLQQVFDIAVQILAGLDAMHRVGIVHRDMKPENVLIDRNDRVKITDYGIGCFLGEGADGGEEPFTGSPPYACPEQFEGRRGRPAGDLYSFGVTFYELLTGRRPFDADSLQALARAHLEYSPPDPRRFRPDLPAPLVALVLQCLEKDPARRPASAAQLRAQLLEAARELELETPLDLEAFEPEPVPLLSGPGVDRASGRLVAAGILLAAPALLHALGSLVEPAPSLGWTVVVFVGGSLALLCLMGISRATRIPIGPPVDLTNLENSMTVLKIILPFGAVVGVYGMAMIAEPELAGNFTWYAIAVGITFMAAIFTAPALLGWIRQALIGPEGAPVAVGKALLLVEGPSQMRAVLDQELQVALPARLLVMPGVHHLLVIHQGKSARYRLLVEGPGRWRTRFGPAEARTPDPAVVEWTLPLSFEIQAMAMILFFTLGFSGLFSALVPVTGATSRPGPDFDRPSPAPGDSAGLAWVDERLGVLADHLLAKNVAGAAQVLEELYRSPHAGKLEDHRKVHHVIAQKRLQSLDQSKTPPSRDQPLSIDAASIRDVRFVTLAIEMLLELRNEEEARAVLLACVPFLKKVPPQQIDIVGRALDDVVRGHGKLSLEEVASIDDRLTIHPIRTQFEHTDTDAGWNLLGRLAVTPSPEVSMFTILLDLAIRKERERGNGLCPRLEALRVSAQVAVVVEGRKQTLCALKKTPAQILDETVSEAQRAEARVLTEEEAREYPGGNLYMALTLYKEALAQADFQGDKESLQQAIAALEGKIAALEAKLEAEKSAK